MDEANNIIKEQLLKLPKEAKVFVINSEWITSIKNISSKFNLEENIETMLEYLVLNVMIGLSEAENITEDIVRKTGIDRNIAEWITESIEKDILERYSELFPEENTVETKETEKFAPNSYEQILVNQAKAMRPVGVEIEGSMNYESRIMNKNVPDNLPTGEIHHHSLDNYGQNKDPYREPAE